MQKSKLTVPTEDTRKKAELITRKVSSGEMTLNEARKEFGLPPIKNGDTLITKE